MADDTSLVDTHVLLWWMANGERLSEAAQAALSSSPVVVSPISFWEVSMLVGKGRVALDRPTAAWAEDVLALSSVDVAPLTAQIAVLAGELPDFHGDPADRLLAATAIVHRCPLITKDDKLRRWADGRSELACVW